MILRPAKRLSPTVISNMKKKRLEKLKPKPVIDVDTKIQRIGAEIKALRIISEYDPVLMRSFKRPTLETMKKNILDLITKIETDIKFVEGLKLDKSKLGLNIEINNFKSQRDASNKILDLINKKLKELE